MSRRVALLLATTLLAIASAGCSDDGDGDKPSSDDVPSGAVATVGDVEISEEQLNEEVEELARAQRRSGSGASGGSTPGGSPPDDQLREQLETQALSVLLQRQALEQEAKDRGIEVDDAEVRRRWEAASKGQFKTKKALRRFLGGQTEQDLLDQLRLQVLTERIHEQVSEEAGGGKAGAKAVAQFQTDFQKRWQDRTACRKGYSAAAGCADDSK
ncbi:MAG TPA: SurA N-terminal domain-containing protein [Thermoleophilaceae bacterium]|nr:SurA N-terminal domain-containing protein [Thermoleophilaceae bacterium]